MSDSVSAALRSLRDKLRESLSDAEDFTFALSSTLDELGLAPTSSGPPPTDATKSVWKQLPAVQQALVAVSPTFLPVLDTRGRLLLDTFFCPPRDSLTADSAPLANNIALTAYISLTGLLSPKPTVSLPTEAREFVLNTLSRLAQSYSIDSLYWTAWSKSSSRDGARSLLWEDAVNVTASLPAKVANAVGRWREAQWNGDIPSSLVPAAYFNHFARRFESLTYELSQASPLPELAPLRVVLEKLASLGLFTPMPSATPTPTPAFLTAFLPLALAHLHPDPATPLEPYPETFFPDLFLKLSSSAISVLANGLLAYLAFNLGVPPLHPDAADERIKRASIVLAQFMGPAIVGGEAWQAVVTSLLSGKTSGSEAAQQARRRVVVEWAGQGGSQAAKALVEAVFEVWSTPKRIKFASYADQFHLTHTLILAVSLLPPFDPFIVTLARGGRFIHAVHAFLTHPDPKIRRLGMLVGELLSQLTIEEDGAANASVDDEMEDLKAGLEVDEDAGLPKTQAPKPSGGLKRLRFSNMWDAEGDGKEECRWLRSSLGVKDSSAVLSDDPALWMLGWGDTHQGERQPDPESGPEAALPQHRGRSAKAKPQRKVVVLDDDQMADPLKGYDEVSPSSSRSPSPTPSYLEEVAADPTLALDAQKKRKLKRPVYVRQLIELLRDKDNAESIEMALQWGEGLVRAKRNFGGEVTENAVALATAAVALADPFNLDDFEQHRQGLVTALVACSPRNVPPHLAELYFNPSFSLLQKNVMLTAIAMGARELAGLSVPEPPRTTRSIDFPTKTLPPALHARYLTPDDEAHAGQLESAVAGMRNLLLSKGARQGEETVPEFARERRLRVGSPSKRRRVTESLTVANDGDGPTVQPPVVPYSTVAAEYFILPLVNRFWDYFQDASIRETRAVQIGTRYRAAGSGLVLSPMALEKYLLTLALLTHAARHAPTFLAVLAPSVLELAVTIGARHFGKPDDSFAPSDADSAAAPEAQVVSAALELALSALDTAVDLDKGRSFALDAPQLVLAAGEWAHGVFEAENSGAKAAGGGGAREGRLRASAAGVVVKVAEIGETWGAKSGMR